MLVLFGIIGMMVMGLFVDEFFVLVVFVCVYIVS